MFLDTHGLVVRHSSENDRIVSLRTRSGSYELPNYEVLVWWKRAFHWRFLQDIGAGMEIPLIIHRTPRFFTLDVSAFRDGLTAYRLYDEDTGGWVMPILLNRKLEGGSDAFITRIRPYLPDISLEVRDGRMMLGGVICDGHATLDRYRESGLDAVASFFYGLVWSHGFYEVHPRFSFVRRFHIQWLCSPTVGHLEEQLLSAVSFLRDYGMMVGLDSVAGVGGSYTRILQLSITDPELVWSFDQAFSIGAYDHGGVTVNQEDKCTRYFAAQWPMVGWSKDDGLIPFLRQYPGGDTIIGVLGDSVLKKWST